MALESDGSSNDGQSTENYKDMPFDELELKINSEDGNLQELIKNRNKTQDAVNEKEKERNRTLLEYDQKKATWEDLNTKAKGMNKELNKAIDEYNIAWENSNNANDTFNELQSAKVKLEKANKKLELVKGEPDRLPVATNELADWKTKCEKLKKNPNLISIMNGKNKTVAGLVRTVAVQKTLADKCNPDCDTAQENLRKEQENLDKARDELKEALKDVEDLKVCPTKVEHLDAEVDRLTLSVPNNAKNIDNAQAAIDKILLAWPNLDAQFATAETEKNTASGVLEQKEKTKNVEQDKAPHTQDEVDKAEHAALTAHVIWKNMEGPKSKVEKEYGDLKDALDKLDKQRKQDEARVGAMKQAYQDKLLQRNPGKGSTMVIALSIFGVVLLICAIAGTVFLLMRRKAKKGEDKKSGAKDNTAPPSREPSEQSKLQVVPDTSQNSPNPPNPEQILNATNEPKVAEQPKVENMPNANEQPKDSQKPKNVQLMVPNARYVLIKELPSSTDLQRKIKKEVEENCSEDKVYMSDKALTYKTKDPNLMLRKIFLTLGFGDLCWDANNLIYVDLRDIKKGWNGSTDISLLVDMKNNKIAIWGGGFLFHINDRNRYTWLEKLALIKKQRGINAQIAQSRKEQENKRMNCGAAQIGTCSIAHIKRTFWKSFKSTKEFLGIYEPFDDEKIRDLCKGLREASKTSSTETLDGLQLPSEAEMESAVRECGGHSPKSKRDRETTGARQESESSRNSSSRRTVTDTKIQHSDGMYETPSTKDNGAPRPNRKHIEENFKTAPKLKMTDELLRGLVDIIIAHFLADKPVAFEFDVLTGVIDRAQRIFKNEKPLEEREYNEGVQIIGDLHGSMDCIINIFNSYGGIFSDTWRKTKFLILGDIVDRGKWSVELIMFLLSLKCMFPDQFLLLRGNHENFSVNMRYGFYLDIYGKYKEEKAFVLYNYFNWLFAFMPLMCLGTVASRKFLGMHGGIPKFDDLESLQEINEILRNKYINDTTDDPIAESATWSDFDWSALKFQANPRGAGESFGPDQLLGLLRKFGIDLVIRGHQTTMNGIESAGKGEGGLITLFSVTNYETEKGVCNFAAVLSISSKGIAFPRIFALGADQEGMTQVLNNNNLLTGFQGPAEIGTVEDQCLTLREERKKTNKNNGKKK